MPEHIVAATGLSVVYEPSENDPVADIVFVHGLQGHPRHTWSSRKSFPKATGSPSSPNQFWDLYGYAPWARRQNDLESTITEAGDLGSPADTLSQMDVYWPVDLLPGDCPQARILTWGYNTTVTEGYKPVNGSDFFAHARNLLYALKRNRYNDPARDLVFVSHSLGGILVKETLRRSHQDEDELVKAIFENTRGVFFFGTPHRGSREWASAAETVSRTASLLLGVDTNSSLLHALLPNSTELQLCQEFFTTQWARRMDKLTVRTYQEGKSMTGLNFRGLNRKIVPDESSNLENLGQQAQVINADHRNICKFNSKSDEGYEMVSGDLRILVGKAISRKQEQAGQHK